ncbi:MAG: hypothetical protein JSU63_18865 [Phycisphaerales bacterium]|nr:MAG: hypothetical protein JSU63_18865 [Phycisphaerales bacterium]
MGLRPWHTSWFPELLRIESDSDRKDVLKKASKRVTYGAGYYLAFVAVVLCGVLVARVVQSACSRWGALPGYLAGTASALACGAAGGLLFLSAREKISRNIRLELVARGMPVCIECGYDLTGNESGVCPECGEPVADELQVR